MDGNDTVEIIGFGDSPLTVDAQGNVSQSAPAAVQDVMAEMQASVEQDVMAQMRAAVGEPAPAEDKPAESVEGDDKPADDKPADEKPGEAPSDPPADDKPSDDVPAEKPADAPDEKPEESADEKPAEDKPADEKPEEEKKPEDEKPAEEQAKEETPPEPSESDKLVEELGGVDVVKAAQPFVESVYDPNLTVSERVSRLESFVPEAQMKEMRNEIFWQSTENPEIQELLSQDPEAREVYAQKVFGVPFGYLEKVFNEHKGFFEEADFDQALDDYKAEHPEAAPKSEAKPAAKAKEEKPAEPKKEEPKSEDKKDEPKELTPAFTSILDNLSTDVDKIYATGQLEPSDKDDAETTRLKTEAAQKFGEEWPKAFMADEAAMKAYRTVKGLSDQGADAQAQHKYAQLSKNAKRVAADLLKRVMEPIDAHRTATQQRAKAAAATSSKKPAATKEPQLDAKPKGAGVDISTLRSDADFERAMQESIERNTKKS